MSEFAGAASASSIEEMIDSLLRPRFQRQVLENGLTLVYLPNFSRELVSVQVWVGTGSIHEGSLMGSGLSHFLEHLLFKGTKRRSGKEISREAHAIGADMNAYTSFDRTVYHMDAPSSAFLQVVDLLSDSVLHSVLPASEVESERDVILREIDMDVDDPDRQLDQALFRTVFRAHPYREPVIGRRSLFEQIKRNELLSYYRARYVPNNMVVAVAGAVGFNDCLSTVTASFGQVPRGRLAQVPRSEEPMQLSSNREVICGGYRISRGALGFKVPHLRHPDSPALDLLAYVLGAGESSLFWKQLRNQKRLVHSIDCRNWNLGDYGLLEISYTCDHEKQAEVESAIFDVVDVFKYSDIADSVLQRARRQFLKDEINRQKTVTGQASQLGFAESVIGDIGYVYDYLKRLQSIEPHRLQSVATRYLIKEQLSAVVLGSEEKLEPVVSGEWAINLKLKPPEQIRFASGARLLLQADKRLPKVHIRCVMLGGPLYEPSNQRGVSELMAGLMTKDTASRSAFEIARLVDQIGGTFSADGGNNTISLAIEVFLSDVDTAIELLSDALTVPVFEEITLQTEREAQIAGLKEDDDEIFEYGFRKLREYFFGEHPFAFGSEGRIEDLAAITRDDLIAHFNQLVTAPNLVISVVGNFEHESLIKRLQPLLESEIRTAPFDADQTPAHRGPTKSLKLCEPLDREQAVFFQAYPDVGICSEDYTKGELLNELFNGMSSRLFENVREDKGLAYYVGASRTPGLRTGQFAFYVGTHPSRIDEVAAEIDIEIARVAAGQVTQEELQRCRTRLKAARLFDQQTIGARALHAALNVSYGLPIESDADYARRLDEISPESLAEFVRTHFNDQRSVRLVVGSQA